MAHLIWTEPAVLDIIEIAEYISIDNPEAAGKLVKKVFAAVERLRSFPESGRRPPELKSKIYREVIIKPCRVFYRVEGDSVIIVHVARGERELRKYILKERRK